MGKKIYIKKGKKMKKRFFLAVLVSSVGVGMTFNVATAEEKDAVPTFQLEEIEVIGELDPEEAIMPGGFIFETARNGVLDQMDLMDIPFSQIRYSRKTIETFGDPSLPLNTVLVNNPSIRSSSSSPMYTDFSLRGINMNGNNVYFNGVPNLYAQFMMPPENVIGSIDVMSGPNTVLNGSTTSVNGTNGNTAPNGIISMLSKRAENSPVIRYTQAFSGRGSLGEYLDLGKRFGKNDEWGIQVNTGFLNGGLAVPDMEKKEKNIFLNLDHKDKNSKSNFFVGYFDLDVTGGQRWFDLGNSKGLLKAPNSKRSFDYEGMKKVQRGYVTTLNHEQKISKDWNVFLNAGGTSRKGYKYDNLGGSLPLVGQTGQINGNLLNMVEHNKNAYVQLGTQGVVTTGAVKHDLSLAVDWSWTKNYRSQANAGAGTLIGNLWSGVHGTAALPEVNGAALINQEITKSITIADYAEYKKWGFLVALQRRDNDFQGFNAKTGLRTEKSTHIATNPTFAVVYKPNKDLSIYGSHSEGYTRARTAALSYGNAGELFHPVKNKQNEVGLKYKLGNLFSTVSFFQVEQGNYFDETIGSTKYLRNDGENRYQGIEFNLNGQIAKKWNFMGGFMYIDGERRKTAKGATDGYYIAGVSDWSAVGALEYEIDNKTSVIGRAVYNGSAYGTNLNKVRIPSYITFDFGVKHKAKISGTPVTFNLMCYNVANKDYWIARGGSNVIGLSMPRTFKLTAQFDF